MHGPGHLVAVFDQGVDLEIIEAVEIGADQRDLRLHHRMQTVGILLPVDDIRDRGEEETVLVAEVFPLQLPDPIPEDVGGPDRLGHESQRGVAEDLKRLARVAHDDPFVGMSTIPREEVEGPCAEVVVDTAVGERLLREMPFPHPQVVGGDLHRREESGKGRRGSHDLGQARHLAGHVAERLVAILLPPLDEEALAVEDREHPVTDVRGEDVQPRLLREFEEPAVAVEKLLVVVLQQGVGGQVACAPAGKRGRGPQRNLQRHPADDVIADVELHEPDHLGGSLGKVLVAPGVAVPVEHEVGRQDAPAGHRSDVLAHFQSPGIPQVANQSEVVERGAEAASGKGQTEMSHGRAGQRGEEDRGTVVGDCGGKALTGTTAAPGSCFAGRPGTSIVTGQLSCGIGGRNRQPPAGRPAAEILRCGPVRVPLRAV